MISKGAQGRLGATVQGPRPGGFPVGSAQSRAAARALLVARKADEEKQSFRVVTRSIVDGSRVSFDGLAECIRAGRLKLQGKEGTASSPAVESGQDSGGERRADCLSERIKRARNRPGLSEAPDSTR